MSYLLYCLMADGWSIRRPKCWHPGFYVKYISQEILWRAHCLVGGGNVSRLESTSQVNLELHIDTNYKIIFYYQLINYHLWILICNLLIVKWLIEVLSAFLPSLWNNYQKATNVCSDCLRNCEAAHLFCLKTSEWK